MGYLIRTRDDFWVNGVSALSVGLVTDIPSPPPLAQARYSVFAAADTDLTLPDDQYENIEYHISAQIIGQPDSIDNTGIYALIAGAKTLEISRLPGYYFRIAQVLGITPSIAYRGNAQRYDIGFVLEPFKYIKDNPEITVTSVTVTNPGTRYARPVWHVTGAASAVLTVNGEALTIAGAPSAEYYIDTERMLVYAPDGTNILPYTVGQLPFLQPGENNVSLSAGTLKVKVNGRCW
jgi:phage-related protein